jgi:hypothetical protein
MEGGRLDQERLQQALEELRQEIDRLSLGDEAERVRLEQLVADIEHGLEHPGDEAHHANVIAGIEEAISRFDVEHPRATSILNHIMVTLGNMGI